MNNRSTLRRREALAALCALAAPSWSVHLRVFSRPST